MKVRLCVKTAVTLLLIATLIMTFIISPVLANSDFVDGSEDHLSTQNTGKDVPSGPTNLGTAIFGTTDLKYPNSETLTGGNVKPNSTVGDESNLNSTNEWREFIGHSRCPTQLVIGINNGISDAYNRLMGVIAKYDCEVVNTVSMAGEIIAIVVNVSVAETSSFVEETRADGLLRYMEPRMKVQAQLVPNDPYWSWQWGPQKIEADWAWNTTIGDPSVLVAVIDTGIDWDHPDLAANYVALGYDWVNNDTDPMDDEGHGTHCAGVIAAVINNSIGVAGLAQVRIMAEKGLDQYGEGYEDDLANAIIHAVDQGADILSNSWGGYGESALIHDAVKYAYDSGVLVVAAAGNEATSSKVYPAAFDEVIAVSATDAYDNPASFTNFGEWVELAAPGVDIYSTYWDNTYRSMSGTSMSTPHVSGVAALIWNQFPNMTRDWVRAQSRFTSDDLGDPGFDNYYGYGRINARNAVEQAPPYHDLLIFNWEKPRYIQPEDLVSFNVTVLNYGISNESNIMVQLLVDGNLTDSASIGFLAGGTSTTVGASWNPTVEGIYNVTAYVVPVPAETAIENNVVTEMIEVRYPIGIVLFDQTHGTDIIAYYSIWVSNLTARGYLIDILTTSPITPSTLEGYDVFVIPQAHDYYSSDELSAIQDFVLDGGGLLVIGDDVPNIYADLTGFAGISWMSGGASGITTDITPHEVTEGVNSVYLDVPVAEMLVTAPALDLVRDPTDGIMLAVSEQVGRVIGFADEGSLWDYGIGYEDNLRLANNMIHWLLGVKYEHELAVRLDAPNFLEPGDSSLLNATVYNRGLSNETDVELFLLINGTIAINVTIPELVNGMYYTIDHPWTPTVEATYNVTAYAVPVPGENLTANNWCTKFVRVGYAVMIGIVETHGESLHTEELANYYTSLGHIVEKITTTITLGVLGNYDIIIVGEDWSDIPWLPSEIEAVEAFIDFGKGFVTIGDELATSVQEILGTYGISYTGISAPGGSSSYFDPFHPIMQGVSLIYAGAPVDSLQITGPAYWIANDISDKYILIAGAEVGGYVLCLSNDFAAYLYGDDNEVMFENIIDWMTVKYEHELAVSLEALAFIEPGESTLLNATVHNRGLRNETSVELFLLINGTRVNNVTIPELVNGTSYAIDYLWTPTVEAVYNITAYAPPVPGENVTANNFAMKIVNVRFAKYVLWDDVHDGDGDSLTGNYLSLYQLLSSSGFVVDELTSGTINSEVLAPYDILVLIDPEYEFSLSEISDIHDWVTSGGALIVIPDAGYPPTLNTIMAPYGVQLTGLDTGWGTTTNIIAHPITQNVGSIYYDRAWELAVSSPSVALAWTLEYYTFLSATTGGEVVVISDSNIMDNYGLGMADNTQLMLNMFNWIGVKYEHELSVSLEAPDFLEPGDSSLLNATVYNRGLNKETDAELQLMINGSIVDYVVIPELLTCSSYTLSYLWTPTVEGIYNLTAYSPPVLGENFTANNWYTKFARVCARVTVYLDSPTINGTAIGEEFNVSVMIRDAQDIFAWQAGLTFNPDLLECTGFEEGEFLKDAAPPGYTYFFPGTINNTAGMVFPPCACLFLGDYSASGSGRLAYATFRVKALGVSDIHVSSVKILNYELREVPVNIIDVYTVVLYATRHTVVIVSNSTGTIQKPPGSGFYGHAFNLTLKKVSFNVTGPYPGFSNITIPKTLLWVDVLDDWAVLIDDILVSGTFTENATHTSLYFTYSNGTHKVQIFGTHAPPPSYTVTIYSLPTGVTFTIDGVSRTTPWSGTYSEGSSVSLMMPEIHTVGDARYYWNQWSDGNTSRSRTVTMNTNVTLTAHYTGPYYQLTVTSSPITGITFTINGTQKTTPYTEWLLEGSYTLVMPETHNGYVWSHWLEDGDTNRIKTITLPETTWTAVYAPAPVGGKAAPINIPINKPELPALCIWLTIPLPLAATTIFVKLKKKKQ